VRLCQTFLLLQNLFDLASRIVFMWHHIVQQQRERFSTAGTTEPLYEVPIFSTIFNNMPKAFTMAMKLPAAKRTNGRYRETFGEVCVILDM
jgi:hypothetical protein